MRFELCAPRWARSACSAAPAPAAAAALGTPPTTTPLRSVSVQALAAVPEETEPGRAQVARHRYVLGAHGGQEEVVHRVAVAHQRAPERRLRHREGTRSRPNGAVPKVGTARQRPERRGKALEAIQRKHVQHVARRAGVRQVVQAPVRLGVERAGRQAPNVPSRGAWLRRAQRPPLAEPCELRRDRRSDRRHKLVAVIGAQKHRDIPEPEPVLGHVLDKHQLRERPPDLPDEQAPLLSQGPKARRLAFKAPPGRLQKRLGPPVDTVDEHLERQGQVDRHGSANVAQEREILPRPEMDDEMDAVPLDIVDLAAPLSKRRVKPAPPFQARIELQGVIDRVIHVEVLVVGQAADKVHLVQSLLRHGQVLVAPELFLVLLCWKGIERLLAVRDVHRKLPHNHGLATGLVKQVLVLDGTRKVPVSELRIIDHAVRLGHRTALRDRRLEPYRPVLERRQIHAFAAEELVDLAREKRLFEPLAPHQRRVFGGKVVCARVHDNVWVVKKLLKPLGVALRWQGLEAIVREVAVVPVRPDRDAREDLGAELRGAHPPLFLRVLAEDLAEQALPHSGDAHLLAV
mmetsp:Transcript_15980/g.45200  ORF Transcript_15980/g.45200 Transcript_15980/m.45200 type:complete len:573 (-) Transcript_15980:609-2327(-)